MDRQHITLWSWPASDCSARLRITLNLKSLPYELKNVDLAKGERPGHSVNPAQTVPTLIISSSDGGELIRLIQSVAALEYLEEAFPDTTPLLPPTSRPDARALIRTLVQTITTDIHTLTTHRVADTAQTVFRPETPTTSMENEILQWRLHWIRRGLGIYEQLVAKTAGKYSVGDSITMADVCLIPEVSTGRKMGLDIAEFPVIKSIYDRLLDVEAFKIDPHFDTKI